MRQEVASTRPELPQHQKPLTGLRPPLNRAFSMSERGKMGASESPDMGVSLSTAAFPNLAVRFFLGAEAIWPLRVLGQMGVEEVGNIAGFDELATEDGACKSTRVGKHGLRNFCLGQCFVKFL
mmetsp:Transcript_41449/g.89622  ORF Transcript_41449/g.89622 Transcript_41449/m.89622 type:complete len:123 (-) Transcript_41449:573-941(-)